jgi:hypothetical protein
MLYKKYDSCGLLMIETPSGTLEFFHDDIYIGGLVPGIPRTVSGDELVECYLLEDGRVWSKFYDQNFNQRFESFKFEHALALRLRSLQRSGVRTISCEEAADLILYSTSGYQSIIY